MSIDRDIIRVTDTSTRAELIEAIEVLRARQRRLPVHFVDALGEIDDEISILVDQINELDA